LLSREDDNINFSRDLLMEVASLRRAAEG